MKKLYFCKTLALLLLLAMAFTSCNDNTVTTPKESPSVSEESSPAPSDQAPTPSPSDNYTDLPVVECEHGADDKEAGHDIVTQVFSKSGLSAFTLEKEDAQIIAEILNADGWSEGEAEIEGDYFGFGSGWFIYSAKGIFSDRSNGLRHRVLTDRQRDTVNGILAKYPEEEPVLTDQSDPVAVLDYLKAILDKENMPHSNRTDFPDAALREQVSDGMRSDDLKTLLSSPHFYYRIGGSYTIEPYLDYYLLSDGSLLEIRWDVTEDASGRKKESSVSEHTVMTAGDFLTRYGLDPANTPQKSLSDLRRALPLCYSIGFLPKDANLANHLGHTADRTRNDLIDAQKADGIKEGLYSGQVFEILGHPHLSLEYTTSSARLNFAWFALSDDTFLQVQYKTHYPAQNDPHAQEREDRGISEDACVYTVLSVQRLTLSQALDYALYENKFYLWHTLPQYS